MSSITYNFTIRGTITIDTTDMDEDEAYNLAQERLEDVSIDREQVDDFQASSVDIDEEEREGYEGDDEEEEEEE